jgi:hypothetical protein
VYVATAVILYVVSVALSLSSAGVLAVGGLGTFGLGFPIAIPLAWVLAAAAILVARRAMIGFANAGIAQHNWENKSQSKEVIDTSEVDIVKKGSPHFQTMFNPLKVLEGDNITGPGLDPSRDYVPDANKNNKT